MFITQKRLSYTGFILKTVNIFRKTYRNIT